MLSPAAEYRKKAKDEFVDYKPIMTSKTKGIDKTAVTECDIYEPVGGDAHDMKHSKFKAKSL